MPHFSFQRSALTVRFLEDPWLRDQPERAGRDTCGLSHSSFWARRPLISYCNRVCIGSFVICRKPSSCSDSGHFCSVNDTSDIGIAETSCGQFTIYIYMYTELHSCVISYTVSLLTKDKMFKGILPTQLVSLSFFPRAGCFKMFRIVSPACKGTLPRAYTARSLTICVTTHVVNTGGTAKSHLKM